MNNINTLSQPNIICNEPSLQNSPKNNKYRSTQESNKNLLFQRVTKKLDTKIDGKQSSESFLFIPPEASMCCLPISQRSADSKDTDLKTEKEVLQWYVDMNAGGTPHTNEEIERVKSMIKELK